MDFKCPNCGSLNPPDLVRCNCGYEVSARSNSTPTSPDSRVLAKLGLICLLAGLGFFGFAFGSPIIKALRHEEGVITIYPKLLGLGSLLVVLGILLLSMKLFGKGADLKKESQRFWSVTLVVSVAALWLGSWYGLVQILHHLGHP